MRLLHTAVGLLSLLSSATVAQDASSITSSSLLPSTSSASTSRSGTVTSSTSYNLATASTVTDPSVAVPTGSYLSYGTRQMNATTGNALSTSSSRRSNATMTSRSSSTSNTLFIVGTNTPTRASNATASGTSTSAVPTNTQPCNNYPEFCNRRYMNVTEVCAHNSAFVVPNNAASNQQLKITDQLDDGVRMIQGETHWYNNDIYACHTSCDLLNAGTLLNELTTVASWVQDHPYDVVTILLVNSDFRDVSDYVAPIQNSGLAPYLYEPPKIPMHINDWPTYGEMILQSKRVVIFMDYNANQTKVPYVLDEFSQMWETPFSPTNASFPCSQQRPPGLNAEGQNQIPYLANHNLNYQISIAGMNLLIPAYGNLSNVNAVSGNASAGEMMNTCVQEWNRPPAWLLVDYYNLGDWDGHGNMSGAVFEVAARLNGVNYTRKCCGAASSDASAVKDMSTRLAAVVAFGVAVLFI